MAGQQNERTYFPVQFGGVLDESATPSKMGGIGLTQAINLVYRRFGAWGKRAGSGVAYAAAAQGPSPSQPSSGVRWYRAKPTPLTQTVIAAQGIVYKGNDPNLVSPYSPLSILTTAANNSGQQASFASAYDPSANGYVGSDILIICGLTGPFGFSTGNVTLQGTPLAGDVISFTLKWPTVPLGLTLSYTILPSDNLASVAQAIVSLINTSALVNPKALTIIPGAPPMNFAYATLVSGVATIHLGSLDSGVVGLGATGDQLQYNAFNTVGTSVTLSPTVSTHTTGGGLSVSAPLKYDGTTLSGLSYMIQQPFTGCRNWHDHVWYWGDTNNPDTMYASDINQPTGFVFMNTFGGYEIGQGDGDPAVQTAIPLSDILYVFKGANIYKITGYSFQSGEYQFAVNTALNGTGIPAPGCAVATHNNAIVFWDGGKFYRLAYGATAPEFIGRTIPLTSGNVARGDPNLMRAVAGDFPIQTFLTNVPTSGGVGFEQTTMFANAVMFACDVGNGVADTVVAYDDDASNYLGNYAWATWTGWTVAAFIPYGTSKNAAQTARDNAALYWIPQNTAAGAAIGAVFVNEYGVSPGTDAFNTPAPVGIAWTAQTGWDALGTPALLKEAHRLLLDVNSVPGANVTCTLTTSGPVNGTAQTVYNQQQIVFPPTVSTPLAGFFDSNQTLVGKVNPFLKGFKYLFSMSELGATEGFEVVGVLVDAITQAFES